MSTVPLNYTIDDGASTTKTLFSNTPQTLDARVARLSQDAIDLSIPPKAFSFANGRPAGEEWWLASTGGYDLEQARYTSHAALARLIRSFIANRVSDGVHLRVAVGVNTQVNDKQMREVAKLLARRANLSHHERECPHRLR